MSSRRGPCSSAWVSDGSGIKASPPFVAGESRSRALYDEGRGFGVVAMVRSASAITTCSSADCRALGNGPRADLLERDAIDTVLKDRLAREARPEASAAVGASDPLSRSGAPSPRGFNRVLARARSSCRTRRRRTFRSGSSCPTGPPTGGNPDLVDRLKRRGRQVANRVRFGVELSALWHFPPRTQRPPDDHPRESAPTATASLNAPWTRHRPWAGIVQLSASLWSRADVIRKNTFRMN